TWDLLTLVWTLSPSKSPVTSHPWKPHYKLLCSRNVRCGSLQCQLGNRYPILAGMDQLYSRTIISIKSVEYECKATTGTIDAPDIPDMGLVRDGTPCGDNLVSQG
ncbi:unnamed protein product, partial [Timema podura]|nr:unnamed protein product [Timema podura]